MTVQKLAIIGTLVVLFIALLFFTGIMSSEDINSLLVFGLLSSICISLIFYIIYIIFKNRPDTSFLKKKLNALSNTKYGVISIFIVLLLTCLIVIPSLVGKKDYNLFFRKFTYDAPFAITIPGASQNEFGENSLWASCRVVGKRIYIKSITLDDGSKMYIKDGYFSNGYNDLQCSVRDTHDQLFDCIVIGQYPIDN